MTTNIVTLNNTHTHTQNISTFLQQTEGILMGSGDINISIMVVIDLKMLPLGETG